MLAKMDNLFWMFPKKNNNISIVETNIYFFFATII